MGAVDVALCMNRAQFPGALAAIHSIARHAERPRDVAFHIVVGAGESGELIESIRKNFPDPPFAYEVEEFSANAMLEDYIRAGQPFTYASPESQVMNFARFYLPQIYPDLGKVIYLDADLVARSDLAELFELATLERHVIAAVPDGTFESWNEHLQRDSRLLRHIDSRQPTFNAGVYVTDLSRWPEHRVLERLEGWIERHRSALEDFYFGTQSILNLTFYRDFQPLPAEWNVQPLGWYDDIPEETLRKGKILHWSGKRKPWLADGLYKEHWIDDAVDREPG